VVVSGDEKLAKPDPAIYALAQRRFGHAPAAMLFIDDSLPNVESARACGWHAHHFTGAESLRSDLRQRGLLA
jgi:2-haloacid dehalogenase